MLGMILVGLGALIGFVVAGVGILVDDFSSRASRIGQSLFFVPVGAAIGGLFGGVALMLVCAVSSPFWDTERLYLSSTELRAINAGSNTEGSFFLGSGSVDEQPVYSYYYMSDGGFRQGQIYADETLIVESNETPHIEKYRVIFPEWLMPKEFDWDHNYIVHVPEGSVRPMIDMDLPD